MKVCKCCGQELPLSMFPTNRHHRYTDGHLPVCLDCFNARCELMSPRGHREPKQDRERRERKTPLRDTYAIQGVKAARIPMTDEERAAKRREYQRAYYRAPLNTRLGSEKSLNDGARSTQSVGLKYSAIFMGGTRIRYANIRANIITKKSWKNL